MEIPNYLTKSNVEMLKRRLEKYWAKRGFQNVHFVINKLEEDVWKEVNHGCASYVLRSDLVDGLPRPAGL